MPGGPLAELERRVDARRDRPPSERATHEGAFDGLVADLARARDLLA